MNGWSKRKKERKDDHDLTIALSRDTSASVPSFSPVRHHPFQKLVSTAHRKAGKFREQSYCGGTGEFFCRSSLKSAVI